MAGRMPVLRQHDMVEILAHSALISGTISSPPVHRQRAARTEIVLHVDDDSA